MSGQSVYIGFWRNYNYGDEGAAHLTLTVPKREGAFMIAFLALFVSFAMTNLWTIACLTIHQLRASNSPRPGLYHQQQVLLSNAPTPATTAWSLVKLARTWKRAKVPGAVRGSAPLIFSCVVYLAGLTAAGLFSSRAQLPSNEVLSTGGKCGWVGQAANALDEDELAGMSEIEKIQMKSVSQAWVRWTAVTTLDYVRNCYSFSGLANSLNACQRYTVPYLQIKTNAEVACPFSEDICDGTRGFQVDTGLVDSNQDLGINSKEEDRLLFRKILTCAPILAEEKYSSDWTDEEPPLSKDGGGGNRYKYYNLGRTRENDYTWVVSNNSISNVDHDRSVYALGSVVSYPQTRNQNTSAWTPIPELSVDDADVTVFSLLNNAQYTFPVQDPWFRTSNVSSTPTGEIPDHMTQAYMPEKILSALACTEQFQFCTDPTNCSPLEGLLADTTTPWRGLKLNGAQKAAYQLISAASTFTTLSQGVHFLGASVLRANDYLYWGNGQATSSALPETHWQTETANFAHLMLAAMQTLVVDFAAPPDFDFETTLGRMNSHRVITEPREPGERDLCKRVRFRDARYSNFSVAGIAVIVAVGTLVVLFNMVALPGLVFWFKEKLSMDPYPKREWLRGNLFMLQRAALEGSGIGPWNDGKEGDIPWTTAFSYDEDGMNPETQHKHDAGAHSHPYSDNGKVYRM